jgi:hypothetical protein
MGAATTQVQYFGGSPSLPAGANAETGIVWSREDTQTGTTAVPVPVLTATNYSWWKNLALVVTVTGTTHITNRRLVLAATPTTGLTMSYRAASYVQPTVANQIAAGVTNGAVPAGFTALSTSSSQYDNTSVSTGSTGVNGSMLQLVLGADASYAGGYGTSIGLSLLALLYDES